MGYAGENLYWPFATASMAFYLKYRDNLQLLRSHDIRQASALLASPDKGMKSEIVDGFQG